jgi:hypothetical protein
MSKKCVRPASRVLTAIDNVAGCVNRIYYLFTSILSAALVGFAVTAIIHFLKG